MNDKIKTDEEIREAIEALGGFAPTDGDVDFVKVYQMEQEEKAQELFEAAVGDGVFFATKVEDEVFVNVKWLGSIVQTMMEGVLLGAEIQPMQTVEVLGQTIMASEKFVEQA